MTKKTAEIEEKIKKFSQFWQEDKWTLEAISHDYYLEDHDAQEGEFQGCIGFDDEDKAIDHLLDAPSKYGSWFLWKWDKEKKEWFQGKVKRKGKALEVVWVPREKGDFA